MGNIGKIVTAWNSEVRKNRQEGVREKYREIRGQKEKKIVILPDCFARN